jgi:hypothetical protein
MENRVIQHGLIKNRTYIKQLKELGNQGSKEALLRWHRLIDVCALDNVWGALQINHLSVVIDAEIGRCQPGFSDVLGRPRDGDQKGFAQGSHLKASK